MKIDLTGVPTEVLSKELEKRKRNRVTEIVVELRKLHEELECYGIKTVDMEENYIYFTGDLGYDDTKKILKMKFRED